MRIAMRADASEGIGSGHFTRCLTLADAAAEAGAHVRFLCRTLPAHLRATLVARGHECVELAGEDAAGERPDLPWPGVSQDRDAKACLEALGDRSWDWVVVDHYGLDARWHHPLRAVAARVMVIDDLANRQQDCDVLVDQNAYLNRETRYAGRVPAQCRQLLGPRFALLRPEFVGHRGTARTRGGRVERLLVSFGGTDPDNRTVVALNAVAALEDATLAVDVVIGAGHPARDAIALRCAARGYRFHVQTARMAELMAEADLAIGAGGSSTWERCCLGLPTVTLTLAENQKQLVEDAAAQGLLYAPGTEDALTLHVRSLMDNPGLRTCLSRNGAETVDGRGTARVLRALGVTPVAVREAGADDSARLFEWRNHPRVRAVSRTTAPILRADHDEWFARVSADANRLLLVGERGTEGVGVVRFDVHGAEAEVSIYLSPAHLESGLGQELLLTAESWMAERRPDVRVINAEVLGHNVRSHHFFTAAGYHLTAAQYQKVAGAS